MIGTVRKMIPVRGYGFITGEDEQDYFVLHEEVKTGWETLRVGDAVTFTPVHKPHGKGNGLVAEDVRKAA